MTPGITVSALVVFIVFVALLGVSALIGVLIKWIPW